MGDPWPWEEGSPMILPQRRMPNHNPVGKTSQKYQFDEGKGKVIGRNGITCQGLNPRFSIFYCQCSSMQDEQRQELAEHVQSASSATTGLFNEISQSQAQQCSTNKAVKNCTKAQSQKDVRGKGPLSMDRGQGNQVRNTPHQFSAQKKKNFIPGRLGGHDTSDHV